LKCKHTRAQERLEEVGKREVVAKEPSAREEKGSRAEDGEQNMF